MKKRINVQKMIKMAYKETKRSSLAIYLILRFLVIVCMILQIIRGDLNNAFLCVLSLVLFTLPGVFQKKFKKFSQNAYHFNFIFHFKYGGERKRKNSGFTQS